MNFGRYLDAARCDLDEKYSSKLTSQYEIVKSRLIKEAGKETQGMELFKAPLQHQVDLFKTFFLPESERERDPHAYGALEISHRIKSLHSIKNNLVSVLKAGKSSDGAAQKAAEYADMIEALLQSDKPSEWCRHLRDFIGFRVIVRSQRNKYQIYRAVKYLCQLNQTERRESLEIPFVTPEDGENWKYYNPPGNRAY